MIGKKVWVNKKSDGNGNLDGCDGSLQVVVAAYQDGSVKTNTGDVWTVRPYTNNGASLLAVR